MTPLDDCYAEIRMYNSLISRLGLISSYLVRSAQSLEPVKGIILNSYSVNENGTPMINKCSSLCNDIYNEANYINNTLIPAINAMIKQVQNDIVEIQAAGK